MFSAVYHDDHSWVENVAKRLPVSDSIFFTPGNALSLQYMSSKNGNWRVQIAFPDAAKGYLPNPEDVLTFKLYVVSNTDRDALPRLSVHQKDTMSRVVNLSDYIKDFRTNMWLDVRVPLKAIAGLSMGEAILSVQLSQGLADTATHWMYVDQIEFLPANPPRVKLSSPAVLASVTAYDRHVDLTWQLPLTPSIRYIKIYRSDDNEHFEPVAIRPVFVQKYTDFIPYPDKAYFYKIAWVDYDYLESPFSDVMEATTQTANDRELLDFIQAAHFNYFLERTEINSGMHGLHFGVDDATVSVMETGLSVLSHIVGVERGFISRKAAIGRLKRIVNFLDKKVERYHGAFPAKIDGRTGKGVFAVDSLPEADLAATAFLMQGLLVAEQYFRTDSGGVPGLTTTIDTLWNDVAWNKFVVEGQENILLNQWSPISGFRDASPMGGFGVDFISYILALASPRYALPPEAYTQGLGVPRELVDSVYVMELAENDSFSVDVGEEREDMLPHYREFPYKADTTIYGMPITVGSVDTSLLEAYIPFLAFDPRAKRDAFANYFTNNINLTKAFRRRDNERGYGGSSRDVWGRVLIDGGLPDGADSLNHIYAINPAIASASYAYLPEAAIQSIRELYQNHGHALFTEYGFRKWLAPEKNAVSHGFDALQQAAVVIMIENGRSGLIWDLFSSHPDIQNVVEHHFHIE